MKKIVLSLIAGWILFIATAYASPYDGYDITNKVEQYGDDVRTVAASPKPNNPPKQNYMYGDTNYPLVGLTTYGAIFLDKVLTVTEMPRNILRRSFGSALTRQINGS